MSSVGKLVGIILVIVAIILIIIVVVIMLVTFITAPLIFGIMLPVYGEVLGLGVAILQTGEIIYGLSSTYEAYKLYKEASDISPPQVSGQSMTDPIPEIKTLSATEGALMARFCGRRARVAGVISWASKLQHYTEDVEVNGIEQTVDRYKVDMDICWGQSVGGTDGAGKIKDVIFITAAGKPLWKKDKESGYSSQWDSVTNHLGGASQSPDSDLESILGTGNVSGQRNTSHTTIIGWKLADWGNSPPLAINGVLQPDELGYTLADAVFDYWNRRKGADAATEIDVSRLTGKNVIEADEFGVYQFEGHQQEGPQTISRIYEQFVTIFDLTVRENAGILEFLDRGDEDVVAVEARHLGCAEGIADSDRPISITSLENRKKPTSVKLAFYSKKHGYQRSSESYTLNEAGPGENVITLRFDGVLLPKQARRIAKRRLIEAYRVGQKATFPLPPDYITVLAGDVPAIPFNGQVYYVRAQIVTVGANYLIEVEGVVEQIRKGDDEILTTAGSSLGTADDDPDSPSDDPDQDDPEGPNDGSYHPPLMRQAPLNLPALFVDKDAKNTGIYYGHCAEDPDAHFKGAKVYRSWQANGGYKKLTAPASECPIGIALTAFDAVQTRAHLDTKSRIRVLLFEGAFQSATRDEVQEGINWLAIGTLADDNFEIVGFQTAVPIEPVTHDYTAHGVTANAPDTFLKTGSMGTPFDSLASVGDFISFPAFEDPANSILHRVVSIAADSIVVDVSETGDLVNEAIGDETDCFLVVNSNVYELSNFFRGLRDTSDHMETHQVGDLVVLLNPSVFQFADLPKAKIGKNLKTKSVSKGLELADVLAETIKFAGETMRCFRPTWFKAEREYMGGDELDDYDITYSWVHVTRFPFPDPTTEEVPHSELDHEGKVDTYKLLIYSDVDRTLLVHEFTVEADDDHDVGDTEGRREKTYTAAQQEADGIKNLEHWIELWEVGTVVKKGNVLVKYVPGI